MVNQIRFGEVIEILQEEREWAFVRMISADYTGWLQLGQYEEWLGGAVVREDGRQHVVDLGGGVALRGSTAITLLPATLLSDSITNGTALGFGFEIKGSLRLPNLSDFAQEFPKLVTYYRNSPYLWGGRSVYGVDCSGLTQAIYTHFGVSLPRDAYQQAEKGRVVDFLPEIQPGDLAFFDNEEGKITHVGIMIDSETILHASAYVRIDKLDNEGIFNPGTKRYTHRLRIVKRYF